MRYIELKGRADIRVIALGLAHGIALTRKCFIVTDDVAFIRVGEKIDNRVYRCDQVYVAVAPELFNVTTNEELDELMKVSIKHLEDATGEKADDVILCWSNSMYTEFEVKAVIQIYRTGMSTVDNDEYNWKNEEKVIEDSDTLKYMVFYDKKKFKSASYESIEKVLVLESEMVSIRNMERDGRFKMTAGGYFGIANDIAVKKCGVFEGALRDLRK